MSLIEGISVFFFCFKCKWNAECVSIQKVSLQSSTYLTQSLQSLVKVGYFSLYLVTVPSECFWLWEIVSKEESVFPAILCLLQGFLLCLVCRVFVVVSLLSQNLLCCTKWEAQTAQELQHCLCYSLGFWNHSSHHWSIHIYALWETALQGQERYPWGQIPKGQRNTRKSMLLRRRETGHLFASSPC